ncbi:MAG: N-acetyltransferase [Deltaproteobacteria bacterium]|nr:N-acetyltransferase [Deltaproteobacteria bacterium]
MLEMMIREADADDLNDVLDVERRAFGYDKEAKLVADLLCDPTSEPRLSLLAYAGNQAVGHVLFTKATLKTDGRMAQCALLAPLAVVPQFQKQGVGKQLMADGLRRLKNSGVELVFVLGHPTYYPIGGFTPAGKLGFLAPYPIPDNCADAWMVQALCDGILGQVQGQVMCATALNKPEHWRE